jgi:hypothetical protein
MDRIKRTIRVFLIAYLASLLLTGCNNVSDDSTQDNPPLKPRDIPDKPAHTEIDPLTFSGIVVVKFIERSDIRLRGGKLVSLANGSVKELDALFAQFILAKIERQFTQPEEEIADEQKQLEAESGEDMPDLNLYYRLTLHNPADAEALIDGLNKLTIVELANPELAPAPPPQSLP